MTMQVDVSTNAEEFLARHGAELEKRLAEHNLMLALCQSAAARAAKGENSGIRILTLNDDDGLVVAAVQTAPHNLVLSHASMPEVEPLADALVDHNFILPGIVGPSDVAASIANRWTEKTGQAPVEYMDQIIYSLTHVQIPRAVKGRLRWAEEHEIPLVAGWIRAFSTDALPKVEQITEAEAAQKADEMVKARRLAVWDVDGRAVAQAGVTGTRDVARISMVYTPEETRGKGYASAVVAAVTETQLQAGKKLCCLYADARNPVANSIYRKIGYEFAGRSSLYVLQPKAGV
ncbi:MAG: GNAT family N-acetyltransferase [Micavibrio sp.]|nr:GNAT family N-acetyltransferase [Micavibrio sp.]